MPDERTTREKLLAMANQTASPNEAEVARMLLARLDRTARDTKTPRILGREQILAAPSKPRSGRTRTVRFPSGTVVTMDEEDLADVEW